MGKSNAVIRMHIGKVEYFADLFNYYLFSGLAIIKAEDLVPIDGESDVMVGDADGKEQEVHRYRDITMRWKYGAKLTILACENQEKIHYAMPVRAMLYDSLSYVDQIKRLGNKLKDKKLTPEEFLSKFQKDDKLMPVITIIFYYGLKRWDASKDLYEMLDVNDYLKESETFKKYVSNYSINLIDAGHMENLENLHTDLQVLLGMLQYRSNTEKFKDYVKAHGEYFSSVDKDTYDVIVELLHSKSKLKKALKEVNVEDGEECINVCKAIDGIYEEGYNKAKEEMMQLVAEAEEEKRKAEEEKRKAEEEKRKAEEEKRKAEEEARKSLMAAAKRMLETMDKETVAELLGLEMVLLAID